MRVVICGSRGVENYLALLGAIADAGFVITEVVSGNAMGADALGERWARENNKRLSLFPVSRAEWKIHGKKAGPRRNRMMVDNADAVIAIWDGHSPGTKSTIDYAQKQGKPVHVKLVY